MKVVIPHMGQLDIACRGALRGLGIDVVSPPRSSNVSLKLGARYSPELACLPFKVNLGNFIDALNDGTKMIMTAGGCGPCRFGYYSILQERILQDMGYKFEMVRADEPDRLANLAKTLKEASGAISKFTAYKTVYFVYKRADFLDRVIKWSHFLRPRTSEGSKLSKLCDDAVAMVDKSSSLKELRQVKKRVKVLFRDVRIDSAKKPVRLGLVGEFFMVVEPFANMDIERKLGSMGVEVTRGVWLSDWINDRFRFNPFKRNQIKLVNRIARPYLKYPAGGESANTIARTIMFAKKGYDGVIHIRPFSCMPELVAQKILTKVEKDYNIPILTLSVDEHSSEVGFDTRIEAFVDMLVRKKDKRLA